MENKILATVNGQPITEADVTEFLAGLGQRGQAYDNPQGRAMILTQLINSRLFLIDAQRNLLEAEPAFKEQMKKMKENLLTNYAVEKLIAGVTVTDAEAEKFYQENPDKFAGEETVNASHILVSTEEEAKDVLAKIKAGEITFEDAAKQYSSCPSKDEGGCLGDFGRGQMVPEFDKAVFAMAEGEITEEPVKTQVG
ncbi:MAG: peptidylprolyl isomerase [Clostridia bacterium]|nr:peptidylprolyl isomerase [Clostridia bacterium]